MLDSSVADIAAEKTPKRISLGKKKVKALKDRIKKYNKKKKKSDGIIRRPNLKRLSTIGVYSDITEGNMESLKKNKVPLTDDEKSEVMKRKAVWHHGPNGEETPAVWKSKKKDGSFTYITNTHRAYQAEDSLKGAINKYHSFIKGTA